MTKTEKNELEIKQIHLAWIAVFGAIWRAWFGGSGKHVSRGWKYLALILCVLAMYFCKNILDWQNWRMYAVIATFCYFWSMGHGAYFKYWDETDDAEDRHPLMTKFVFWLCGGKEKSRTFWGNFVGMFVRYTFTAIFVSLAIPNAWFLLAGLMVAVCYVPAGLCQNTKIGEVLAGASVFSYLWWCL